MLTTKQHKEEFMYHKQLITRLEKYSDYQLLTTNKLNRILHQAIVLSSKYLIRRINEKADGANAHRYKAVPSSYMDRSKAKREKLQLELLIKIVDYMIQKFDFEKEISDKFD